MIAMLNQVLAAHAHSPELMGPLSEGYEYAYLPEHDNYHTTGIVFEARRAGALAGSARLVLYKGDYLKPIVTHVDPDHRRRGLATAMYVLAECLTRHRVYDFWCNRTARSPEIDAFWRRAGRAFGWSPFDGVPWDAKVLPRYCVSPGSPGPVCVLPAIAPEVASAGT